MLAATPCSRCSTPSLGTLQQQVGHGGGSRQTADACVRARRSFQVAARRLTASPSPKRGEGSTEAPFVVETSRRPADLHGRRERRHIGWLFVERPSTQRNVRSELEATPTHAVPPWPRSEFHVPSFLRIVGCVERRARTMHVLLQCVRFVYWCQ